MWVVQTGAYGADALGIAGIAAASSVCVISAWTDLSGGLILDVVTTAGLIVVLACSPNKIGALEGAGILAGSLAMIYFLTARRGIGFGDVKFGLLLGASLGTAGLLGFVGDIGLIALIGGVGLYVAGRRGAIPFGPFLSAGYLAYVVWGSPLATVRW